MIVKETVNAQHSDKVEVMCPDSGNDDVLLTIVENAGGPMCKDVEIYVFLTRTQARELASLLLRATIEKKETAQ